MNKKKPAVIAKTAAKKRGRPAGSKNKVKDPFENEFAAWVNKVEAKKKAVDWQQLCGRLQEALAKEMKDNEVLKDELCRKRTLWERLVCLATGVA